MKHGHATRNQTNPLYNVFMGIIGRCFNPNHEAWARYGGRGITMCGGWRYDFPQWLRDMGPKPTPEHTVERKDNDGHYSCGHCEDCLIHGWPSNVIWATRAAQVRNSSHAKMRTLNNETRCLKDWAEYAGLTYTALHKRLSRGASLEEALKKPLSARYVHVEKS